MLQIIPVIKPPVGIGYKGANKWIIEGADFAAGKKVKGIQIVTNIQNRDTVKKLDLKFSGESTAQVEWYRAYEDLMDAAYSRPVQAGIYNFMFSDLRMKSPDGVDVTSLSFGKNEKLHLQLDLGPRHIDADDPAKSDAEDLKLDAYLICDDNPFDEDQDAGRIWTPRFFEVNSEIKLAGKEQMFSEDVFRDGLYLQRIIFTEQDFNFTHIRVTKGMRDVIDQPREVYDHNLKMLSRGSVEPMPDHLLIDPTAEGYGRASAWNTADLNIYLTADKSNQNYLVYFQGFELVNPGRLQAMQRAKALQQAQQIKALAG